MKRNIFECLAIIIAGLVISAAIVLCTGCSKGPGEIIDDIEAAAEECTLLEIDSIEDAIDAAEYGGSWCGDVTISGEGLSSAPLLVLVGGDLVIEDGTDFPWLMELTTVMGDIHVTMQDSGTFPTLFPLLTYVGGEIVIHDARWETEFDLDVPGFDFMEDVVFQ